MSEPNELEHVVQNSDNFGIKNNIRTRCINNYEILKKLVERHCTNTTQNVSFSKILTKCLSEFSNKAFVF